MEEGRGEGVIYHEEIRHTIVSMVMVPTMPLKKKPRVKVAQGKNKDERNAHFVSPGMFFPFHVMVIR